MMTRALLWGVLLLLLAGCPKGEDQPEWGARAVRYPASWPIPELTVPPGAMQVKLPDLEDPARAAWEIDGQLEAEGQPPERRNWSIAFTYGGPGTDVQLHIDDCLKPLGYRLLWDNSLPGRRGYITPDGKRQVNVEYLKLEPVELTGFPGWEGYRLGIAFWSNTGPDVSATKPLT
jgi:hypothetical protein